MSSITNGSPTAEQVLSGMKEKLGKLPASIEKALGADPAIIFEHARSNKFAMPDGGAALDDETRTLVYLAAALASSNSACTQAMVDKARAQGIATAKLLEVFHIARFEQATQVLGNAEPLLDLVNERTRVASTSPA